jgi:flagellar hook protein FlgE
MSFSTALSGLNAAANNLSVISNNIANANTTGFKDSRAEFADVYASSIDGSNIGGGGIAQPGAGVSVATDAQQFTQGTTETTGNSLDMAINGGGFFTLASDPANLNSLVYSRSGAFQVNNNGLVINSQGQALLAYKPNGTTVANGFSTGVMTTVSLNTSAGLPTATTKVNLNVNLDASSLPPAAVPFDPLNPNSFTKQTSATIYDSLGVSHNLATYFVAGAPTPATPGPPPTPATSNWTAYHYITDNPQTPVSVDPAATPTALAFDSTGKLISPATGALAPWTPPNSSAAAITATMDYTGSTQLASLFSVNALSQNGLAAGTLTGIGIDSAGVISANYSNGSSTPLGKVALTMFANPQGLTKLGGTNWGQSTASGSPISGTAGAGQFGQIKSGALEQSNVDLSQELVNLISAQQAYQANSQSISTENKVIETIMNAFR